ncbi:uncharacterized protein LOC119609195 [Lucilia sericata]|uniref:uncharacterized protein LOC119609195 n=1 Tax=Lucilia sericata TaxID=13632 RepID=UPI0018A8488B|nr:uncharacterized protein LOC119609195 [Lucilia sericata]
MSDESSDCSDMNFRPSGSRGRQQNRQDQKRKRRIVMRIEFDDSDDSSSASDRTSDDEVDDVKAKHNNGKEDDNDVGGNDLDDDGPSCSIKLRGRQKKKSFNNDAGNDNDEDSDEFQRNAANRRLRRGGRRINVLDVGFSDGSSSGSEITRRKKSRGKKYIVSEDERESTQSKTKDAEEQKQTQQHQDEQGFTSDSSSNDLLEKCPICLLTFRQQEIGSPSTCDHIFCANCIEAWSKNVQTCPIDRIEFQRIIVRESFENRTILREINVDPNAKKELVLEDELFEEEDVTNCEVCNRPDREDVMLLCDHCNQGYHMDCLSPPLTEVPEGSWFCDNCVDSEDESDDEEEDLNMLYEDIRDMGLPESRFRVREVQQPRILRTRQNERIRAAILRRTRASIARIETTTSTTTINSSTTQRGRPRTTTTTTTRRSTTNRNRSVSGSAVRKTRKTKRRRGRQRTYVVEYDLNNFDEKFAIKTTKKVIKRRRRRKKRTSSRRGKRSADGVRMTASKRLAEQMGVKPDPKYTSQLSGTNGGLSLFGGANDLEYFSDSDNDGNIESEIHIETGHGTAVQTSVRISNYGSQRSRKGLLLGRLQPNRGISEPTVEQNNSNPDILSSIMDMQDRWHSAARNLESVHINKDGTLNLPQSNGTSSRNTPSTPISPAKENTTSGKDTTNGPSSSDINQAPMYSRGGGNANFNRGGGGGGGYNNRSNNQNNYRGGGGGGGGYRHSTGGGSGSGGFGGNSGSGGGGMNFNMVGRGNFNFSNNPNYNGNPTQPNNSSPFQQRNFNQRNQQNQQQNQNNQANNPNNNNNNNNPQRHSLPFSNNRNDNMQQQQQNPNIPFGGGMPQTSLPPPSLLHMNQQPQQNLQNPQPLNDNSLFGGLPPPMTMPPPHLNVAPPPVLISVPPPPAPPPVVIPPPGNSSLFQLNSDYGIIDDDSNCPNFAIYSHESQQVAKSSETYPANAIGETSSTANEAKEDDENEDLVQLDDDDEIPMPPDPNPNENVVGSSELYEPENPTEENDEEDNADEENENQSNKNDTNAATKDDGDDYGNDNSDDEDDDKKKNKNKKQEIDKSSKKYDPDEDILSECSKTDDDLNRKDTTEELKDSNNDNDKIADTVRSPSPAVSDIRLPEIEKAAASRKGVLELYDDSDWEELDIDRPKDNNKSSEKTSEKDKVADGENEKAQEEDRSYTPCLDENNDPEEHEAEGGSTTPLLAENSEAGATESSTSKTQKNINKKDKSSGEIENMDTELISDEEDELDRKKNHKSGDKRADRRDNDKVETFKKIGNKQKGRNYRGDKQPATNNKRSDKKHNKSNRSVSRSRSVDSFRSRGGRSRSRSPRFRGRGNRSRSRSRSNNKENQGRWGGNFRDGGRFGRNNQNNRLKRRELQRYDVRNVIGNHSPSKNPPKDRYGRDTSRTRRNSRSQSRGRRGPPPRSPFSRSRSRSRNRRLSISLSPSPSYNRRRSLSPSRPIRQFSPGRRRSTSFGRRTPPFRQRSRSPLRVMRSRSISPGAEQRMNGRKVSRHLRGGLSPPRNLSRGRRSRSLSMSPRYTPRLSRSRSKSPRPKGKKKKVKESRKKKSKRRVATISPSPNRRISRQPDPFEIEKPPKKKRRRSPRAKSPIQEDHGWSPSPSPPPQPIVDKYDYQPDKNVSWTPPMQSPLLGLFNSSDVRSVSRSKEKNKRSKKKKKSEKRRDGRKEKKRKRRTETPEPAPSKEVFASGNNILVSVSFNKETTASQQHTQQTIVTLPPNREDLLSNRRTSIDHLTNSSATTKKRKEKRKKIDTKPVAIIDLERSPFQVEQEPTDVIVLTDSEEATEREQREHRRDRRRSESCPRDVETETHRNQRSGASGGQRGEKSPERMDTIHEESYDLTQTGGPKTPPEPPIVKFNLQAKKQNKTRNPLHEEDDDLASDAELNERQQQQQQESHRSELDAMHVQSSQKIGPNTPPESGPCSPDAYDPFEPTKSPTMSPRSPTPPPSQLDVSQNTICGENGGELGSNQKHLSGVDNEQRRDQIPGLGGNVAQGASLNPVDLVMALINSKSASNIVQDIANKSNDSQHINNMGGVNSHDDSFRDKADEGNAITVLSNLLITSSNMQHIPSISSPTPPTTMSKKVLPGIPKIGGSVGGSSSSGVNVRNGGGGTSNNADDSFNMNDIESPYSPGSADYEDLFEPPPDTSGNKRRSKRTGATAGGGSGKPEVFDNLFGSSSPVRLPSYTPTKKHKSTTATRKTKIKGGKSNDDNIKVYDDVPNSAVDLQVKDKFLRKLNRQERVVEEVKLVLKPRFNKKQITKDDYKEIMRRAVPKICHSKSGEINPFKIKKLIEAYVKKFRAKHKKLNIVNTGQVSSAVKCAAYLKKL